MGVRHRSVVCKAMLPGQLSRSSQPTNNQITQPLGLMTSFGTLFPGFQPPQVHTRFQLFPNLFQPQEKREKQLLSAGNTNFILKDSDCQLAKPLGKQPCVVQCSNNLLGNLFHNNAMVKSIQNAIGGVANLFVPVHGWSFFYHAAWNWFSVLSSVQFLLMTFCFTLLIQISLLYIFKFLYQRTIKMVRSVCDDMFKKSDTSFLQKIFFLDLNYFFVIVKQFNA